MKRDKKIARWSHSPELYKLGAACLVKMLKLKEVTVQPKTIETLLLLIIWV